MRALLIAGIAATIFPVLGAPAFAQAPRMPGELALASNLSTPPAAIVTAASPVIATDNEAIRAEERHDRHVNRIWIASMIAMAAASGFDAGTSWGKFESNGLLASPDGTFGARGLSIKAGVAAAIIVPQILLHKHKDLRAKLAAGNFAGAGVFTGVAIHNLGIAAPAN